MKTLLILLALILPTTAFAQTSCPGTTYLGGGQGWYGTLPNISNWTNLNVTFPNGAGSAYFAGPFVPDVDAQGQTCNPSTWNGSASPTYGTVTYNDGTISYTGAARLWYDMEQSPTPYCVYNGATLYNQFRRLKIQSCTAGHTLTNRFIAVSCDGSYCAQGTNAPCDTGYLTENWINLSISGF